MSVKKQCEIAALEAEIREYSITMPRIRDLNIDPNLIDLITSNADLLLNRTFSQGMEIIGHVSKLCEDGVSYLVELEHCHKNSERVVEKVYGFIQDGDDVTAAVARVEDALRFTYVIVDEENYLAKITEYLQELEREGCCVYEFLNFWGNEFYQGINVLLEYKGVKFEVQFHTQNSYEIKEGHTREPYIVARNRFSDPEMVAKANVLRKYYNSQVRVPQGAIGFQYKR